MQEFLWLTFSFWSIEIISSESSSSTAASRDHCVIGDGISIAIRRLTALLQAGGDEDKARDQPTDGTHRKGDRQQARLLGGIGGTDPGRPR